MRLDRRDRVVADACARLRKGPEARVAILARDAGMSPRHFQRVFTEAVGVTPSRYAKLKRFIRALYLIPRLPTLTSVAHAACYTDHAHFCRDFREFAAMTPDACRRRATSIPGHLLVDPAGVSDPYKTRQTRVGTIWA